VFDSSIRRNIDGTLERISKTIDFPFVTPDRLTALGFALGLGGSIAAWNHQWASALILWLVSRFADGLDGSLARRRINSANTPLTFVGGYLDIMADFAIYSLFVVGVAHGAGGSLAPFLWVLLAYYLNGTAFLAFSSIGERAGIRLDDGRSLSFMFGLAEGAETIAIHSLWCIFPGAAERIAEFWAGVVLISATVRILQGYKILRRVGNESGQG
jgi:phosphatidylserine synthase